MSDVPANTELKLISRRAYAESREVSHTAVNNAVKAGKIPLVNGMIDPEIADRAWLNNRDGSQDSALASGISGAATADRSRLGPSLVGAPQRAGDGPVEGSRAEAELRKEIAKADLAEIQASERKGEVVRVSDVRESLAGLVTKVQSRLLMIPPKVGLRHGAAAQRQVEDLIASALQELSEYQPDEVLV